MAAGDLYSTISFEENYSLDEKEKIEADRAAQREAGNVCFLLEVHSDLNSYI